MNFGVHSIVHRTSVTWGKNMTKETIRSFFFKKKEIYTDIDGERVVSASDIRNT